MSPIVITYIGFFVAAFILAWAVIEICRRLYKRRKIDARIMNTWVPLRSSSSETSVPSSSETESDEQDSRSNQHSRAQQNGHYSESKKI